MELIVKKLPKKLTDGLLAYWKLDNNSWSDSSGNGRTLTIVGSLPNSLGLINNGASFSSDGSYLNIPYTIAPLNGQKSYSGWVKFNNTPEGYQFVFMHGGTFDQQSVIPFYVESNGTICVIFSDDSPGWTNQLNTNIVPEPNVWNHFVTTFDGSTATLYWNSQSVATSQYTGSIDNPDSSSFALGAYPYGNFQYGTQTSLDGTIDEVGVWDRALTQSEIKQLYNAGSGITYPFYSPLLLHMNGANNSTNFIDSSINNLPITVNGNPQISTAQSKFGGSSAYFDGDGSYLDISNLPSDYLSQDFTIEAWVWIDSSKSFSTLFNTFPHNSLGISLKRGDAYDLTTVFIGDGSDWFSSFSSDTLLSFDTWQHVALVRRNNTITLYENGIARGSINDVPSGFDTSCRIGSITWVYGLNDEEYKGYIDEFRIIKNAAYTSNFTPPNQPFPSEFVDSPRLIVKKSGTGELLYNPIAFWHLNEISGTRLSDPNSKKSILNLQENITIPTLLSSPGSSQNYVFSTTDDIYFEAEIYLNSYDNSNPILSAMNTTYEIVNEFMFFVAGVDQVGDRGIPAGSFVVYNGERGESLTCYYTNLNTVNLNEWTKVTAKRTNGVWSLFINNTDCSVSRVDDAGVPNDQFGNQDLFVYIGRAEADDVNFDGQIKNLVLNKKFNLSEGDGSVPNTIGKIGNAANFNGTSNKFLTNSSISLGSTFSIACWVKLNSYNPNNEKGIWGCGTSGNHLMSFYIVNSNNTFRFYNDGVEDIITDFIPDLNTWYHSVITVTPNGAKLYIDGNLIGSVVYSPSFDSSWTNFSLSNFYTDGPAGYPIDAVIDEAGIWDIELSQEQVTNIYRRNIPIVFKIKKTPFLPSSLGGLALWLKADAGVTLSGSNVTSWADQSVNGRTVTVANSPTFTASSINSQPTVDFDGETQFVDALTPAFINNNNFSVIWVFKYVGDSINNPDAYSPSVSFLSDSGIDQGAFHYIKNEDKFPAAYPLFYKGWTPYDYSSGFTYSEGSNFIMEFISNQTSEVYSVLRNNTQEGSDTISTAADSDVIGIRIAGQQDPSRFANIKMAEIIVYNRVLTTPERQQVEAYLNQKYSIY